MFFFFFLIFQQPNIAKNIFFPRKKKFRIHLLGNLDKKGIVTILYGENNNLIGKLLFKKIRQKMQLL